MSILTWLFPSPVTIPNAAPIIVVPPKAPEHFTMSDAGIKLLVGFEGVAQKGADGRFYPYLCPAGFWTIGAGHVVLSATGQMLKGAENRAAAFAVYPKGLAYAECMDLLRKDLLRFEAAVNLDTEGVPTNQDQFDAMVSLAYNVGTHALETSSVLRLHKAGEIDSTIPDAQARQRFGMNHENPDNAADAFLLWDMGGGRILNGLVDRRMAERRLYLTP